MLSSLLRPRKALAKVAGRQTTTAIIIGLSETAGGGGKLGTRGNPWLCLPSAEGR